MRVLLGNGYLICLMKISIIFFFLWNSAFAQSYVASWTGTATSFQLQRSKDNLNWTIIKNTDLSTYTGVYATYYWRVKLFVGSKYSYSNTVWVYAFATVTNAKIVSSTVSWKGYSETNLSYYIVANDANFFVVPKKGNYSTYSVKVSNQFKKYNIIGRYKNGDERILKTVTQ